ncbi:MAG: AAA family ATPase [Candidatus Schekmanbacteria bacterium]|nr:AAA family ATPase [Candidatus Schekmanbacteria bacterium]
MIRYIIGLTGSLGSGCTTVAKHLEDKMKFAKISISKEILEPLAKNKGKPFGETGQKQDFGNLMRGKENREEYKKTLFDAIEKYKDNEHLVIECFRNPIEIEFLRDRYPHFYLIALYAPEDQRRDRKKHEKEFDKIDQRDKGEDNKHGQQVRKCVNQADIVIDNSMEWRTINDAENFFSKVESYITLLKEPYRAPTNMELNMHLAYSVSLLSSCIQRQVGAVITDFKDRVLSVGQNSPPTGQFPCIDIYSQCYRRIKKKEHLIELRQEFQYCPHCGYDLGITKEEINPKTVEDNVFICNSCNKNLLDILSGKELDFCRSLHAEENAILSNLSLQKTSDNLKMYVTTFPCMLCAKKIVNSGIKSVIFVEPYPIQEARDILMENNVMLKTFEGVKSLSFNWIFRMRGKYLKEKSRERQKNLNSLLGGDQNGQMPQMP